MKILDIYAQYPIALVKGEGIILTDDQGKKYVDFYGGHGVISIGHSHPLFKKALTEQLDQLAFYSNAFKNPLQDELASLLGEASGYTDYNLFLSNSGAEANENAFKVASFITGRKKILAVKGAFHGRSAGAIAVTDNKKIQPPFGSEIEVDFIDITNEEKLKASLQTQQYAAFIIEGIQGVNGVREASESFWNATRLLCKHTNTLLIADEVQSGYARSGKFFAHQYHNVTADVVTVGKGMGNGFPVAGTLINPDLKLEKGMLGTTFGGGQLACAAAISVLKALKSENMQENALHQGEFFMSELLKMDGVKTVRGRGLMVGIEFNVDAKAIRQNLINTYGIVTGFSGTDILRILPPLNVDRATVKILLDAIKSSITEVA